MYVYIYMIHIHTHTRVYIGGIRALRSLCARVCAVYTRHRCTAATTPVAAIRHAEDAACGPPTAFFFSTRPVRVCSNCVPHVRQTFSTCEKCYTAPL